jgi:hypothetical protein
LEPLAVVDLGGFATLESQVGKGTTVYLYLPRAAEGPVQKHAGQTDSSPQGDGQLILVVEDADLVRKVTLERLEAAADQVLERELIGRGPGGNRSFVQICM